MKRIAIVTMLLAAPAAFAETGGYIYGGANFAGHDVDLNDGTTLEFEPGNGFNVKGGVRFSPGVDVQFSLTQNKHDGGDQVIGAGVSRHFDTELTFSELRLGAFYAPPQSSTVGFRVGGGYIRQAHDLDTPGFDAEIANGLFAEGAVLIDAGKVVTFDLGSSVFASEHDDDHSGRSVGLDLHAYVFFHTGPVDFGVGVRGQGIGTEYDDGDSIDERLAEFRLMIGGSWGYPKKR